MSERDRRLEKVDELRAAGRDPYPVRFDRTHTAAELHEDWGGIDAGSETTPSCASPDGSCCCAVRAS